jgi:hypothetical protein
MAQKEVKYFIKFRGKYLTESSGFTAPLTIRGAKPFASEEEAAIHAMSLSLPEGQYDVVRRGVRANGGE